MYCLHKLSLLSVRKKILLLMLIAFLSCLGIIVKSGLNERRQAIEDAKHDALLLVNSLAANQEQIEVETRELLSTLAKSTDVQQLDEKSCTALLAKIKTQHPIYSIIGVVTPDGDLLASSGTLGPGVINVLDQEHVRDTIKTHEFSAGGYRVGRITGFRTIHYGYPVFDSGKNLVAIVTAGLRLDKYTPFIEKANLPTDSVVVITDQKGIRLYRSPQNNLASLGRPVPANAFEWMSRNIDEGIFEGTGGDGSYRINAFKRIHLREDLPPYLYMLVGVTKSKVLQRANFIMFSNLLILGVVTLVAVVTAWVFTAFAKTD